MYQRRISQLLEIKKKLLSIENVNSFSRVNKEHTLDIYVGLDSLSRYALLYLSNTKPSKITSSKIINVEIGKRDDDKWTISFSLNDNQYSDLFFSFCSDIVNSSNGIGNTDEGMKFICLRYEKWQKMLSKSSNDILSIESIKGLLGELCFLKEVLIPLIGCDAALKAWVGIEMADQDFLYDDKWFEIKATSSGSNTVTISSIEQLDTLGVGELVIIYLDKTSPVDERRISLNSLYLDILEVFTDERNKLEFIEKMIEFGYRLKSEYDEIVFRLSKIDRYSVQKEFPLIKRSTVPSSVVNIKYELSIASIKGYQVG